MIGTALVLAVAAVLRFAGRDRFPLTSVLFYPISWTVQIAGWMLLSGILVRRRTASAACLVLAGAAIAGWAWETRSFRRTAPAPAGGDELTVLFWNIDRPRTFPEAAWVLLRRWNPDVAVFAEAGDLTPDERERIGREFSGWHGQMLDGDLLLLTRAPADRQFSRELPNRTHFHRLGLAQGGAFWQLGLTDFGTLPPHPRTAKLNAIRGWCANRPRTVIAGDFNTPLAAIGFDAWREHFRHGLADCDSYNGGFETWPHGLPLLSIDHIWMSRDLAPVEAHKGYVAGQDHAWLFVRVRAIR